MVDCKRSACTLLLQVQCTIAYVSIDSILSKQVLKDLLHYCKAEESDEDTQRMGTHVRLKNEPNGAPRSTIVVTQRLQILEVYALQIQMYTALKDNKKLYATYENALRIKSGIPHPVI